jgi:DNA-binding FadR family transcriptional regulator
LQHSLQKMEAAEAAGDLEGMVAADAEFHLALAAASHNQLVSAIFHGIHYVLHRELQKHAEHLPMTPEESAYVLRIHQELLAAVKADNPARAKELILLQVRSFFDGAEVPRNLLD